MELIKITANESGQRFDKYLKKLLSKAPDSFIYKMLRKKNIVLNGKKADGKEILFVGDEVKLFLSDETFEKFRDFAPSDNNDELSQYNRAYQKLSNLHIIYEDKNILIVNKPSGVLSQKAMQNDISVNEWLIGYMLANNLIDNKALATFKPSVCNRLDRNTSGMVACGKSLVGSQYLNRIIKDKSLEKYYYCLVAGDVDIDKRISGYLYKDEFKNSVTVYVNKNDIPLSIREKADYIDTAFKTVKKIDNMTLLEVQLFTGKPHQIRAHLAEIGHPIIGDTKYGNEKINREYSKLGVKYQLLHAHKLVFPKNEDKEFENISEMVLECEMPDIFIRLTGGLIGNGNMEH
jgi:23S rRNA pseudouridine955/2504/2580 synthase